VLYNIRNILQAKRENYIQSSSKATNKVGRGKKGRNPFHLDATVV